MMKIKKRFLPLLFFVFLIVSCEKDNTAKQLHPYYNLTVNGKKIQIDACGSSDYVAEYLRDRIFAGFGCAGESTGFFIQGQMDGTYILGNTHKAGYSVGPASYETDTNHIGTITIRSGNFQAEAGTIPIIEGEFSYDAIDKTTGLIIKVTNGKYLLKKY